jgi:serine/threonine protein kinase
VNTPVDCTIEDSSAARAFASQDSDMLMRRIRRQNADRGTTASVFALSERTSSNGFKRLAREYELAEHLDGTWALQPLELVHENGRTTLILEDPGGELLGQLLNTPMDVEKFLRSAIGIAASVGKMHERGLVHKDIKPDNILLDLVTEQVKLTGFGVASRLPRERQAPEPPEYIAGTLAYMAPEQTGRMNRLIDSRSDLYSLGVTFYEMLTGCLPFTASDPMEWVHCHIARQAHAPSERASGIPEILSSIVMKLLAKTAEERYQTASGIESDLRRCLSEWQSHHRVDPFQLGVHDAPDRFLLPEKLYTDVSPKSPPCSRPLSGSLVEAGRNSFLFPATQVSANRRSSMNCISRSCRLEAFLFRASSTNTSGTFHTRPSRKPSRA